LSVVQEGKILDAQLKIVMEHMLETWKDAQTIIAEQWFDAPAVSDDVLRAIAQGVLDANPAIIQQYKDGKTTTIGFFVWQLMKQTWGKINPKDATQIFADLLQ
jgi:aspartyl-tRNA(Asn)/glutamyl-tRNA(Gln) amidotransferase subunit B